MRQPADEFARYLRRLRQERGMGSTNLSKAIGRSRSYLGVWERNARVTPNPGILRKIIDVLKLNEAESRELQRLAAARAYPHTEGAEKHRYAAAPTADADGNLLHALLEVEHDWPSQPPNPNPHSERARILLDAVGWTLARAAIRFTDVLPPFTSIRWPDPLIQLGIFLPVDETVDAIDIPKPLLSEEMPFIEQLKEPVTVEDVGTQSLAMARVYRQLLFADFDRTRTVVSLLQHWSYDRTQRLAESLSLRFHTADANDKFGLTDVSCSVVTTVSRRTLAGYLWEFGNELPPDCPHRTWSTKYELADQAALLTLAARPPVELRDYEHTQPVRDALYVASQPRWGAVLHSMSRSHRVERGSQSELEAALTADPLAHNLEVSMNPWNLSVVDRDVLLARARALHALIVEPGPGDTNESRHTQDDEQVSPPRKMRPTGKSSRNAGRKAGKTADRKARKEADRKGGKATDRKGRKR